MEVASLVLARGRRKIFAAAGQNNFVFWEVKMVQYVHIFYTARHRRKQFCFLGGQNGGIYIPVHLLHSPPKAKKFGVLGGQNSAIYTHLFFFGQNAAIYTHFGGGLGSKCYHIYTFWVFLGDKMLP